MRVLAVSAPLVGHVFPMAPVLMALRDAGHAVTVATGGDGLRISDTGLATVDVAPGFDFVKTAKRIAWRHPLLAKSELAGRAGTRGVAQLFGAVNDALCDAVMAAADDLRPDLVVYESLAPCAALVAARHRIPGVTVETTLHDGRELAETVVAELSAAGRRHQLSGPAAPVTVLRTIPASIAGADRPGDPMRYVPYSGTGVVPEPLRDKPSRPRILVSRSTVGGPGADRLMRTVVSAASDVDADIVLVRPDDKTADTELPGNVSVVDWLPLDQAMSTSTAIVHHGGAGTAMTALARGIPQLITPGSGDRRYNAETVAARGAGIAVPADAITAEQLHRLIADQALATAASRVAEEIAAMPAPADLVDRLAHLAS